MSVWTEKTMNIEIEEIKKEISQLNKRIEDIQNCCSHEKYNSEYKADTGNYDPSENIYWLTVDCLDCGKFMSFDSVEDRDNYHKFSPNNDNR